MVYDIYYLYNIEKKTLIDKNRQLFFLTLLNLEKNSFQYKTKTTTK